MSSFRYRFGRTGLGQRTTGSRNSASAKNHIDRMKQADKANTAAFRSWHDGTFERVRIGKQANGEYGIKIWDSAGVLQFDETYA